MASSLASGTLLQYLAAHKLACTCMIQQQKSTFTPFKLGDQVWLDTRNLKMNYHKKIRPRREGPFKVTKVFGPIIYQLELPKTWKIHNVFHAFLLRQYKETEIYRGNFPKPPPELIEGEEVYKVENILRRWKRGRCYQYYVK